MGSVFENRYIGTYKMIAEFGRKFAVGPRYWTFIFLPLLLAAEYYYMFVAADTWMSYGIGVLLLLYLFPHFYAWTVIRNDKKNNNGVMPESVITFDDAIRICENGVQMVIEYRKITRVVHLKHSYVLMTGKRTAVMLEPNSFTQGSFTEFKQFLREKRPDLTIPE